MQLKLSCKVYWFKVTSVPFVMSSKIKKEDKQMRLLTHACMVQAFLAFCPKEGRGDRAPLYSSFTLLYSSSLKLPFLYKALQRPQKARPFLCKHPWVLCRKRLTYSPKTTLHKKASYRVEPCLATGNLAVGRVPFIRSC